jgi:biotin carboxyl carrier protein
MRYHVKFPSGEEIPVEVSHLPTGEVRVSVNGKTLAADILDTEGAVNVRIDGRVVDLLIEGTPPDVGVVTRGARFYAKVESDRHREMSAALGAKSHIGEGLITSPMNGRVLKVLVSEGDVIAAGTPLVVVEAMKMENEILASRDGKVARLFVTPGETVESGAKLVEIEG